MGCVSPTVVVKAKRGRRRYLQLRVTPVVSCRRLERLLATLRTELPGPPGLCDMNEMARAAGRGETPAREHIVVALRERGWFASSSIFHPLGIRTDAPSDEQVAAVQSL